MFYSRGEKPKTFKQSDTMFWNLLLCHATSLNSLRRHIGDGLLPVAYISSIFFEDYTNCKYRNLFAGSLTKVQHIFWLHIDTNSKIYVTYDDDHKYIFKFFEYFSRYIEIIPLTRKVYASDQLLRLIRHLKNKSGNSIWPVHTYSGTEFCSSSYLILNQLPVLSIKTTYRPAQNVWWNALTVLFYQ